jgi:hypothetical protein
MVSFSPSTTPIGGPTLTDITPDRLAAAGAPLHTKGRVIALCQTKAWHPSESLVTINQNTQ